MQESMNTEVFDRLKINGMSVLSIITVMRPDFRVLQAYFRFSLNACLRCYR